MKRTAFSLLLISALFLTGCPLEDRIINVEQRMIQLERENRELRKQVKAHQETLSGVEKAREGSEEQFLERTAGIGAALDQIREENRVQNGRIEEIEFLLNNKIGTITTQSGSLGDRLAELEATQKAIAGRVVHLEQHLGLEPSEKMAAATGGSPGTPDRPATEAEMYASAKAAFDRGDLDQAREAFAALIAANPKSANADNAQFWIGEVYFRKKWYEKAILEYQKVIEQYPKGNKVAGALLKQGLSFEQLGDKANAALILKELVRKFPNSNEAAIAGKKLEKL